MSATGWSAAARSASRSRARVGELLALVGLPDAGPQISRPALRRPAAARGAGARAGDVARPAAARRAPVGARCPGAAAPAPRDQGAAAAARRHHHHGDARPGGGAHHGRPHRGDEPGRDRAGRHAAGSLSHAGDGVRRRLRRRDELPRRDVRRARPGARSAWSPSRARRRTAWRRAARFASASGRRTCGCATCRPTCPIA